MRSSGVIGERMKPANKTRARSGRPSSKDARTPMMRQYLSFKEEHPESVLFFRMGDFYEMFYDDAETVSEALGLTLTARGKGPEAYPMAGIPHHALDRYLPKMIDLGFRVAICEQVQDPKDVKGNAIVERAIVDIVTPGTLTDDKLLSPEAPNFIAMVTRRRRQLGLAWADISTGGFQVMNLPARLSALRAQLQRIQARELLIADGVSLAAGAEGPIRTELLDKDAALGQALEELAGEAMLSPVPDWTSETKTARRKLTEFYGVKSLEGFGLDDKSPCVAAAGALLHYLEQMKAGQLGALRPPQLYRSERFVRLDGATIRCLELVSTLRGAAREGTLLGALNRTATSMGARLLRDWILSPLLDRAAIQARLDCVAVLKEDAIALATVRTALRGVYDLERLAQKVANGRANPRDLANLRASLDRLPHVREALDQALDAAVVPIDALAELARGIDLHQDLRARLHATLVEAPAAAPVEGPVIQSDVDDELAALRQLSADGESSLEQYQADEVKKTGITSLKVGYNRVFGYYIEVTNAHRHKVPEGYTRKQTLKNAERYITQDLKAFEEKVLSAQDKALALETELFDALRKEVSQHAHALQLTAGALARLDVVGNFAEIASERGYVRPDIHEELAIEIDGGRHPVLDVLAGAEPFVPNDTHIGGDDSGRVHIITGPNMAGKSTYIRQVALLTLMAQIGCYLPADEARIGLCDRIFTRIGSADELVRGLSTFMVEMVETANILNNATNRSLVVLDEVGRGTSTYDGVSIAWAMSEFLDDKSQARTLFATHYHELTQLSEARPTVKNFNVSVREWQDEIIFLRKIIPGGADRSYGIQVARLAGVPNPVLTRARAILADLESGAFEAQSGPSQPNKPPSQQLSLFVEEKDALREALDAVDPNNTTPMEALALLEKLKKLM